MVVIIVLAGARCGRIHRARARGPRWPSRPHRLRRQRPHGRGITALEHSQCCSQNTTGCRQLTTTVIMTVVRLASIALFTRSEHGTAPHRTVPHLRMQIASEPCNNYAIHALQCTCEPARRAAFQLFRQHFRHCRNVFVIQSALWIQ